MKKIKNISIFREENTLFFQKGNNYLLQVAGSSVNELVKYISEIETNKYQENDFTNFLERSGLIDENKIVKDKKIVRTVVLGNFDYIDSFLSKVSGEDNIFSKVKSTNDVDEFIKLPKDSYDFVFILGPIFNFEKNIRSLSDFLYQNKIDHICASLELVGFSIGPILSPRLSTCSLESYSKRRKVNSSDFQSYESFLTSDLEQIKKENIVSDKWLDAFCNMLQIELQNFLSEECMTKLLGNVVTFDFEDYNIHTSKVLKIPYLEVYEKNNPVNSFA